MATMVSLLLEASRMGQLPRRLTALLLLLLLLLSRRLLLHPLQLPIEQWLGMSLLAVRQRRRLRANLRRKRLRHLLHLLVTAALPSQPALEAFTCQMENGAAAFAH